MCSKGGGSPPVPSSQSTAFQSATAPSAFVKPFYENYLQSAQSLASTPFNPAMLGSVAPMDPMQTQAGNQLFNLGMDLGNFDPAAVKSMESPYTEDVVNATQDWFNNQNQIQGNQLLSKAIQAGNAFGGDRAGIAEAELAGQQQLAQAPVIAGLRQSGYTQALNEYNQLKQMGMAGAGAALGWGGQLQQQAQKQLDVAQQNAMMQSAYPFQLQNWYGSALGGMGPLLGSFSQGYTTPPEPGALQQGIGIATALTGLAGQIFNHKHGGPVGRRARGGLVPIVYARGGLVPHLAYGGGGGDDYGDLGDIDRLTSRYGQSQDQDQPKMGQPDFGKPSFNIGELQLSPHRDPYAGAEAQMKSQMETEKQRQASLAAQGKKQDDSLAGNISSVAGLVGKALPLLALLKRGGLVQGYADGDNVETLEPIDVVAPAATSTGDGSGAGVPGAGWAGTVAPEGGGAYAGQRVATPEGWGPRQQQQQQQQPQGGLGPRTTSIPGMPATRSGGMGDRGFWPALTMFGAGLASRPNWYQGVGAGATAATNVLEQRRKENLLDQKPELITQGGEIGWRVGNQIHWTGMKTLAAKGQEEQEAQRQYERSKPIRGPDVPGGLLTDPQQRYLVPDPDNPGQWRTWQPPQAQTEKPATESFADTAAAEQPPATTQTASAEAPPRAPQGESTGVTTVAAPEVTTPSPTAGPAPQAPQAQAQAQSATAEQDYVDNAWNQGLIQPAGTVTNPDALGLGRNDAALQGLTPKEQDYIKSVVDYKRDPRTIPAKHREKVMGIAQSYDQDYNPGTFNVKNAALKNFHASGVEARGMQAQDMAMQHIGRALTNLEKLAPKLYEWQIANQLNQFKEKIPGVKDQQLRSATAQLDSNYHGIATELMKAFRNGVGVGSQKEIQDWIGRLDINQPLEVQRATLRELTEMLYGRISTAANQYNGAMGPAYARSPVSWLSPVGRDTLNRVMTVKEDGTQAFPPSRIHGSQPQPQQPQQPQQGGGSAGPTEADRAIGRRGGEFRERFIKRFNQEP